MVYVRLTKCAITSKIKFIKEIKASTRLVLKEAKPMIDGSQLVLKAGEG